MKKFLSVIAVVLILAEIFCLTSPVRSAYSIDSLVENCRKIYTANNEQGSYIYGYDINTLYSAEILPSQTCRYVNVTGKIRSVCHSGEYTYALCEKDYKSKLYSIIRLNPENGEVQSYNFADMNNLGTEYFSVSENKVYYIKKDSVYAYVARYSLSGIKEYEYSFNSNVMKLFCSGLNTYAVLYDGRIYRLDSTQSVYCTTINSSSSFSDAGSEYIFTDSKYLVSLRYGTHQYIKDAEEKCVVCRNGEVLFSDGSIVILQSGENKPKTCSFDKSVEMLFYYKDSCSVVFFDNSVDVFSKTKLKYNDSVISQNNINKSDSPYFYSEDGIMCGIESGTSVADFKKALGNVTVYDKNGKEVTSGKLKTGYQVLINSKFCYIAVRGDITGEGNVKSNDVSLLMNDITGKTELNSVFRAASDFNYDGEYDNRDLVLISRKSKE